MLTRPQKSGVTFNFASLRSRHPSHFQKFSASIEQANRLSLVSRGPGIDVYGTASFLHGRITLHWFRSGVLWGNEAFCISCTVYVAFKCFAVKLRRTGLQPHSNVHIVFLSLSNRSLYYLPHADRKTLLFCISTKRYYKRIRWHSPGGIQTVRYCELRCWHPLECVPVNVLSVRTEIS